MRSYPLEKIRLATPDEMLGSNYIVQMLEEMSNEIKNGKLMVESTARDRDVGAPSRAPEMEQREDLALQQMGQEGQQEMGRKMRRLEVLDDLPLSCRSASQGGSTSMSTPESKGLTPLFDFGFGSSHSAEGGS